MLSQKIKRSALVYRFRYIGLHNVLQRFRRVLAVGGGGVCGNLWPLRGVEGGLGGFQGVILVFCNA